MQLETTMSEFVVCCMMSLALFYLAQEMKLFLFRYDQHQATSQISVLKSCDELLETLPECLSFYAYIYL